MKYKSIKWVLVFSIIGISILWLIWPSFRKTMISEDNDRQVEITQSHIRGFHKGKRSWDIMADLIWAGKSQHLFRAKQVHNGKLFDRGGEMVVTDLAAELVDVNTRSKTLMAHGNVTATLLGHTVGPDEEKTPIQLSAQHLRYFDLSKRSYLEGNITLIHGKTVIKPQGIVEIDHDENIVYVQNGLQIEDEDFTVSANKMQIDIDETSAQITGQVEGLRKAVKDNDPDWDIREKNLRSKPTHFFADALFYKRSTDNIMIRMTGNIRIRQEDKEIQGDESKYNKAEHLFEMEGNLQFKANDVAWLIDDNRKAQFKNNDMQDAIYQNVTLTCDRMWFNADTRDLKLVGNVKIVQPDKTFETQVMEYEDKTGNIFLDGRIRLRKKNKGNLDSKTMHFNMYSESFKASGGIDTIFKINTEK